MLQEPESIADEAHTMFRETFLHQLRDLEAMAAFRQFSTHLYRHLSEGFIVHRYATPAEARGEQLQAVAADLRYLTDHLREIGSYYDADEGDDEFWISPRDKRWTRYAARLSKLLAKIVSDIEAELRAGLEVADEDDR